MKKFLLTLFACVAVALVPVVALAGCGKKKAKKNNVTPDPEPTHTHVWAEEWSKDATNHWHTCTGCDEKKDEAAHVYDDDHDTTCNVCGYVREVTHEANGYGFCTIGGEYLGTTGSFVEEGDNAFYTTEYFNAVNGEDYFYRVSGGRINHETYFNDCDGDFDLNAYVIVDSEFVKIFDNDDDDNEYDEATPASLGTDGYIYIVIHMNENYEDAWFQIVFEHTFTDAHDTTCDICGTARTTTHAPVEAWSYDETHHWHACTRTGCSLKFDYEEHGGIDEHGFCTDCDGYLGTILTAGNEVTNINSINGKLYLKVTAAAGQIYEIRLTGGPSVSNPENYLLYYKDGENNYIQVASNPRYSSPYDYMYINNESAPERDYYVEINYNGTMDSMLLSLHTEHLHIDDGDYGFTCNCGYFNGQTVAVDASTSLYTGETKTINYRVPIVDDHSYYILISGTLQYSEFDFECNDSMLATQWFSMSNDASHPTTMDYGYTGYIYFTYETTETRDGSFTIVAVHNPNDFGVCTICGKYAGEATYDEEGTAFDNQDHKLEIVPELSADETAYYRLYVQIGGVIAYTIKQNILDGTVTAYYYDAEENTLQTVEVPAGATGITINDSDVNEDDPYIYLVVHTNSAMISSEKIQITI